MTVVNTETGEIVEYDAAAAERRAERITLRLDAIAENYSRVLPMIREAIEKRDDIALGYRSPGDYVSDRFGESLAGLGIEARRAVVGELTEAGMSTRAIAPIVGVDNATIHRDRARVADATPRTSPAGLSAAGSAGAATSETQPERVESTATPRPVVVGIDGKSYTPPKPRPLSVVRPQSGDEQAIELVETIARNLTVLSQMVVPERRAALIEAWPKALGKVSPAQTDRFTPDQMRAVADGLHDLADEWSN